MKEPARDGPGNTYNEAQSSKKVQDWEEYTERLDITRHDFPYIGSLVEESYSDWEAASTLHEELSEALYYIADHEGNLIKFKLPPDSYPQEEAKIAAELAIARCLSNQEVSITEFASGYCFAIPVRTRSGNEPFLVLGGISKERDQRVIRMWAVASAHQYAMYFYKRFESVLISDLLSVQRQAKQDEQRRSILFQIVRKLHAKIDVDSVLSEAFEEISGLFPNSRVELLMSQDHVSRDPRIKSLQFHGEQGQICVKAFTDGQMISQEFSNSDGEILTEIAVPLIGKQGIYGVFHFQTRKDQIGDMDLELISMIADTAGTAFENAKLYEQSNLLISELRLINELTKRLNQSLRLKEVFKFATNELLSIFQAEFCCISQLNHETGMFEVTSSNVDKISGESFPIDYGFSGLVYETKEAIILSDYRAFEKIPSKFMEETGARSLIAAPLMVRGEVNGAIMLSHRRDRYFSYDNYKLLQILSSHIGLAIANASLHAEVRKMANRDMLTGMYARHYLDDMIHEFQKRDDSGALILVDIDHFKRVNDTFGHQVGDQILKQVSGIIKSSIRKTDIAARWGGEELALYLPGADMDSGYQIAETIRLRVAMETSPQVTVSCGVSFWKRDQEKISVESLFYAADMALYKAKNNGRNRTNIK